MPAQFHISVLSGTLQPLLVQFDSTSNFGGYDMDASARTPKVLAPGEGKKLQILAEMGWVKLSGSDTAGAYAIMEGQTPPGAGPPQHRHSREDEAFYVLEGEYEFNVGGQRIRAPGGTFVFGPRGVAHSFRNIGATPARMLIVTQPAGIEKFFEELGRLASSGPPELLQVTALAASYGIELLI
jgi:quercetin dioxygenase-like cupin family protein